MAKKKEVPFEECFGYQSVKDLLDEFSFQNARKLPEMLIGYKCKDIHVSDESPVGQMVLETINGVRAGEIPDDLNWMCKIKI